jgi:hypothetical protein
MCRSQENHSIVVNKGEILHLLPDHPDRLDDVSPIPEFKPAVKPQLFILEDTPYISVVQSVYKGQNWSVRPQGTKRDFFSKVITQKIYNFIYRVRGATGVAGAPGQVKTTIIRRRAAAVAATFYFEKSR